MWKTYRAYLSLQRVVEELGLSRCIWDAEHAGSNPVYSTKFKIYLGMKKLLEHLTSIRDYLHSQEDILRRQEEEKFNKKINSLVLELCNYLNQDITKLSVSNNRYIVWKKQIIIDKRGIDAFRTKLCQKTAIPSTAINMYLLTTSTTIVTTWADIREHASSKERLKDYIQIFGHTMLSRPYFEDKIICLDCKKAFILENNEIKEF